MVLNASALEIARKTAVYAHVWVALVMPASVALTVPVRPEPAHAVSSHEDPSPNRFYKTS